MKNIKHYFKGFTLVELIIVITILSILAVIAYISFKNYSGSARDSIRVTDIKTIHNWLTLLKVKTGILPKPDNGIEIKLWEEQILTYQWEAWIWIRNQIRINGSAQDPKDKSNYIYSTDKKIDKIQLMWYLESWENVKYISHVPNIINEAYANELDYTNKYVYVYWDQIWIITNDKKIPINLLENTWNWFNILDQELPLITYFWWDVYENWKSTSTWNLLALQLDAWIIWTLPCSSQTYDGYNISQLSHWETKIFTKQINISNGNQIKQFTVQCKNWNLDILHATEIISETNCSTNWYVSYDNQCVENKCQNNIPDNASANSLNDNPNTKYHLISWTHNLSWWDCTFICNDWYSFNNDSNNPKCNVNTYTITFNWNWATSWGTSSQALTTNQTTTLTTNWFTRTWYTFAGWATTAGWAVAYINWSNYTIWTSNVTLYAVWNDNMPPTITNVTVSSPSCNNIRFTINGASDNWIWLHWTPYSFDGWVTWQGSNYKDYSGSSYTINANLIKVKDNNWNIYTYTNNISWTSSGCCASNVWQSCSKSWVANWTVWASAWSIACAYWYVDWWEPITYLSYYPGYYVNCPNWTSTPYYCQYNSQTSWNAACWNWLRWNCYNLSNVCESTWTIQCDGSCQ